MSVLKQQQGISISSTSNEMEDKSGRGLEHRLALHNLQVSARCSKGDNTGSIQAAALLIYSHFTQVQSYRSGLRGLYAQQGEVLHPGKKKNNTATDHKKTFSRSASTHS